MAISPPPPRTAGDEDEGRNSSLMHNMYMCMYDLSRYSERSRGPSVRPSGQRSPALQHPRRPALAQTQAVRISGCGKTPTAVPVPSRASDPQQSA